MHRNLSDCDRARDIIYPCFLNGDESVLLTVGKQVIDVVQDNNFMGSYIPKKGGSAKEVKGKLAIARQTAIDLSISGNRMT